MTVAFIFYIIIAVSSGASIGATVDRRDSHQLMFALLYCALWPVSVPLVLASCIHTAILERRERRL